MAPKLPRPSRKHSPRAFYLEYVPTLWDALTEQVQRAPWRVVIGASLEDAGQKHTFGLEAAGTVLRVHEGLPERAHITFVSDMASFRIAMFDLLPRVLKSIEKTLGDTHPAESIERYGATVGPDALFDVPGTIDVRFTDDAGDEARVEILIAGGEGPRAELHASDADLWLLLESGGRLTQLLRSRAEVHGDVAFLLRVAGLLEPA